MTPLGWTAADETELALLVDELVTGYYDHLEHCQHTRCPHLETAVEAVLVWRRRRQLETLALQLRARQDLADWQAVA